jgi:hypothetical protein
MPGKKAALSIAGHAGRVFGEILVPVVRFFVSHIVHAALFYSVIPKNTRSLSRRLSMG